MEDNIEYDKQGRLRYNPEFHHLHGVPMSEEELEYLCKYYHADGRKSVSMALGRTESTLALKMYELKKAGLVEYYKKL